MAEIQAELSLPQATVTLNDKIMGSSGQLRQIDVSVRKKIAQFDVLIVLDAKAHKRKLDIKAVEEFKGLADDVGANKGAMGNCSRIHRGS
jgi:hypothetical protein